MEKRKQSSLLSFVKQKKNKTGESSVLAVGEEGEEATVSEVEVEKNVVLVMEENSGSGSSSITNNKVVDFELDGVGCGSHGLHGDNDSVLCYESNTPKSNDIASFKIIDRRNNLDPLQVINNIWKPPYNFNFPSYTTSNEKFSRKFQYAWFQKYPWLAYSEAENAAYCKYCVFFSRLYVGNTSSQCVGYLVQDGFKQWKRALEYFNKHNNLEYHKTALLHYTNLKKINENKKQSIDVLLDQTKAREVSENRDRLKPIIKTIIFCGKQGLALRGHRDHGPIDLNNYPTENEGNFRALLRERVDAGDKILEEHLRSAKKNAFYTSFVIQNEIINICGSLIQKKIIEHVILSKYFSILVDETTDISNVEQLTFCIRYIDKDNIKVCEDFLCFVPISSTTAENISSVILNTLNELGLDIKYLRGQGYDGAAAISGQFKGTQAYISEQQPKAIYVHCMSHCLNLAVSGSCKVQDIRNCLGIVEKAYVFLNTPKRQQVLCKNIDKFCPTSKRAHLKQLCPTRWVERHDSVLIFVELLEAVCETLTDISEWPDRDSSSNAILLLNSIRSVNFLVSILVSELIFSYSIILSRYLQKENLDLAVAIRHASSLHDELLKCRSHADSEFKKVFTKITSLCATLDITPTIPRINKRQTHRSNIDASDPETYYRISIFVPFLDSFIQEINDRFLVHKDILSSFSCLVSDFTHDENFARLAKFYEDDLIENGAYINQAQLNAEYLLWKREMNNSSEIKHSVLDILSKCQKDAFPNIYELLKIIAVMPVTTATAERSYSTLRRLKTYLRNSTGENRLTSLALMNIHYEIRLDVEDVLNKLSQKARRMNITL